MKSLQLMTVVTVILTFLPNVDHSLFFPNNNNNIIIACCLLTRGRRGNKARLPYNGYLMTVDRSDTVCIGGIITELDGNRDQVQSQCTGGMGSYKQVTLV